MAAAATVAEPEATPEDITEAGQDVVDELAHLAADDEGDGEPEAETEPESTAHHVEDPEEHARRILHEEGRPAVERIQDAVLVLSAHALSIEDGPYLDLTYACANYSASFAYQQVIAAELRKAAQAAGRPSAALVR